MKSYLLFCPLLMICAWMACSKPDSKPAEIPKPICGVVTPPHYDCDTIVCTMLVAQITLTVLDKANNPVVLDSFYMEDSKGRLPSGMCSYDALAKAYMILNDGWVAGHRQTWEYASFKGFKNGVKVVDENYALYTNCCHVAKYSGADTVIVH